MRKLGPMHKRELAREILNMYIKLAIHKPEEHD
jgi:hypothetical protein